MPRCEDACPADSRPATGNCFDVDPADGLPVQCVGPWESDKHDPLAHYIEATWGARAKFLKSRPGLPMPGGAAFVDLYAGPGRARVRSTGAVVNGSPLIALQHAKAPFTKVIACDIDPSNADALRRRMGHDSRAVVIEGSCHDEIDRIVREIPPSGLNFALIDPYSLDQLDFGTIAKLARVERMDMLIHFPTMDTKRNWAQGAQAKLTKALGTDAWREKVRKPRDVTRAIDTLRERLKGFGYTGENVRSLPVKNGPGGVIYHLVYASKDRLGNEIWESIVKLMGRGQRSLL